MGLTAHLSMFPKLDMQINNKSLDKLSKKELLHLVWKKYTRPVTWDTLYGGFLLGFFLLLKTPPLLDGIKTRLYVNLPVIIVNAAGHEQQIYACTLYMLKGWRFHSLLRYLTNYKIRRKGGDNQGHITARHVQHISTWAVQKYMISTENCF